MKFSIQFITLLCFIIILTNCKDKEDQMTNDDDQTFENLATIVNTQNKGMQKFKDYFQEKGDTLDAIFRAGQWFDNQAEVTDVIMIDEYMLELIYSNGLTTSISFIGLDQDGLAITRGGMNNSGVAMLEFTGEDEKYKKKKADDDYLIDNNKVLVFTPFLNEFYNGNYPFDHKFKEGEQELEVTYKSENEANLSVVNSFGEYGFVIINTHGDYNGFAIKSEISKFSTAKADSTEYSVAELKNILASAAGLPLSKISSGELKLSTIVHYNGNNASIKIEGKMGIIVTDKYVKSMPAMKNAIVFGNYCFSGYARENNIPEAFKSIGAKSFYGYGLVDGTSNNVDQKFAIEMEDSLITNLVKRGDSTGVAHLANDQTFQHDPFSRIRTLVSRVNLSEFSSTNKYRISSSGRSIRVFMQFRHNGDVRYRYPSCGLFEDPRDKQTYKLFCTGSQTWFAENLRFDASGSLSMNGDNSNDANYGRLYNYPTVSAGQGRGSKGQPGIKGICPDGWHMPSRYDWKILFDSLDVPYDEFNGFDDVSEGDSAGIKLRNAKGFNSQFAGEASRHFYNGKWEIPEYNYYTFISDIWTCTPLIEWKNDVVHSVRVGSTGEYLFAVEEQLGEDRIIERYKSCRCIKNN